MTLALLIAACEPTMPRAPADPAAARRVVEPETDVAWRGSGALVVGSVVLELEADRMVEPGGNAVASGLYEAPVVDGADLCAATEGPTGAGWLRCWRTEGGRLGPPVSLATGGRPDRIALAEGWVAWVASPAGLPQVFVATVDGNEPPRALTNIDLAPGGGGPPPEFVPPPHRDRLHFEGDHLRWQGPDGPESVPWR